MELSSELANLLLDLARAVIRARLADLPNPKWSLEAVHDALQRPSGCFVSLHELHTRRLRGCVGQIEARDPVLCAVSRAAVAVLEDPRFAHEPVTLAELAQ